MKLVCTVTEECSEQKKNHTEDNASKIRGTKKNKEQTRVTGEWNLSVNADSVSKRSTEKTL